ncbi:MAG: hypothetical protein WCL50_15325, partial [Spirochaetota bacterium]
MMPPLLFLACLLALGPASLAAVPTASVVASRFTPEPLRVGQRSNALVELAFAGGEPEAFSLVAGTGLPLLGADDDPELSSARLEKRGSTWLMTLVFIPWSPGPATLPALRIGDIRFPAVRYEVESALARAMEAGLATGPGEISPPRPQRDPPGTALYLYGFLGLCVALVALALSLAFWIIPGARALLARWKAREAWLALSRTLDWLESNEGVTDPAPYYALLSRSLRTFLAKRLIAEAESLTPGEMDSLPADRYPDEAFREALSALL